MKKIKMYEDFLNGISDNINIVLDVSGSISNYQIQEALYDIQIQCDYIGEITLIQVSDRVEDVETLNGKNGIDIDEILNMKHKVGTGESDLYAAIEYIIDNDLNDNKTYIISDFIDVNVDFSELSDYEKIVVE